MTMGALLSYSIISGLLMLAMYLAYRLFLARDNQHGFNRGILLLIYAVSFTLSPLMLSSVALWPVPAATAATQTAGGVMQAVPAPLSRPVWGTVLIWIFIAGMAVVAARTVITWVRLTGVIRSGRRICRDSYTLVVTDDERFAPFSWMRYVVISQSDCDSGSEAIITHELKHIACRHWIDLLVAQAVCIVNWFDPAAWLMRDELMLVHEYQADMAVIDSGHDTQAYQMLLIKKAVGARFPSLANSLNHSKLKKRITMMYKEKSGAGRKVRALALVPMLALALGVAGIPAVRAAVSTIGSSDVSLDKDSENIPVEVVSAQTFKVADIRSDGKATTVTVLGHGLGNSLSVNGATFTNHGKTYQANALNCNLTNGTGTIIAIFPFTDECKKASMTIMMNGHEVPFNLEEYSNSSVSIHMKTYDAVDSAMKVIIDGKEADSEAMKALSPDSISSITVDRQKNAIIIKTRI